MKEFIYEQPVLEEPAFGTFIAGTTGGIEGEGDNKKDPLEPLEP